MLPCLEPCPGPATDIEGGGGGGSENFYTPEGGDSEKIVGLGGGY